MSSPASQLFGHRSLAELVTEHLRAEITGGAYAPGAHLVEREISEALGVSSIPVREAFARLVEEGLVVRVPRRGAFVAPLSPDSVRDLTRVRIALEQLAVELAIEHWTPEAKAEADRIVAGMRKAAGEGDKEQFFHLDEAFHQLFWRVSKSETLLATAANLRGRISRFLRDATANDRRSLEASAADHKRWVAAVDAGDLEAARAEVVKQTSWAADRIVKRIEERQQESAQPAAKA